MALKNVGSRAAGLLPSRESALEIGLVSLGLSLVVGFGAFLASELVGRVGRARGRARPAPTPGSLPPQRHRNISSVSTR